MAETELKFIAALAIMGFKTGPKRDRARPRRSDVAIAGASALVRLRRPREEDGANPFYRRPTPIAMRYAAGLVLLRKVSAGRASGAPRAQIGDDKPAGPRARG